MLLLVLSKYYLRDIRHEEHLRAFLRDRISAEGSGKSAEYLGILVGAGSGPHCPPLLGQHPPAASHGTRVAVLRVMLFRSCLFPASVSSKIISCKALVLVDKRRREKDREPSSMQ